MQHNERRRVSGNTATYSLLGGVQAGFPLDHFIKRTDDISACAARFSRCMGRGGETTRSQNLSETIMGLTAAQRNPNISGPNPERRLT
jgi:hypothetical protein